MKSSYFTVAQELQKLFHSLASDHADVVVPERAFARLAYADPALDQSETDESLVMSEDKARTNPTGLPDLLPIPTNVVNERDETMDDAAAAVHVEHVDNEPKPDGVVQGTEEASIEGNPKDNADAIPEAGTGGLITSNPLEDVTMTQHDTTSLETMKPPPVPPRPNESTKKRSFELFAEQNDVTEAISKVMDQLRWAIKADEVTDDGEQIDSISRYVFAVLAPLGAHQQHWHS